VGQAYPLIFTLGVAASLLWLALSGPERGHAARVDAGLAALAGGLVGARAGFVLVHLDYFASRPAETLWFWQGGLSWVGGAIGACASLLIFALASRQSLWPVADALALPTALMALAGWGGCLLEGCAYGRRAEPGPLTLVSTDMLGWTMPRYPTQAAGMIYSLLVVALIFWLGGRRKPSGLLACLGLTLVAAGALALAFTRGDPVASISGLRLDGVGAAAVLLPALILLGARAFHRSERV
jgi:phosphatidylglycerol:prolipoprotein diacylglycerol transferase